jgi:hypothetical protein
MAGGSGAHNSSRRFDEPWYLQLRDREVDHRDGLAALMTFVMRYVDTAQKTQPATWQGLQHSEPKKAIQAWWSLFRVGAALRPDGGTRLKGR